MRLTRYRTVDSPVGLLTLAGQGDCLTSLVMEGGAHPQPDRSRWVEDKEAFPDVVAQVEAYFAGDRTDFDAAFRLDGTSFQRRVWGPCVRSPTGRPAPTVRSPAASANPGRRGLSGWPTGATRLPSSSLAIGSSGPTAPSPGTPEGSRPSAPCSTWSSHVALSHDPGWGQRPSAAAAAIRDAGASAGSHEP